VPPPVIEINLRKSCDGMSGDAAMKSWAQTDPDFDPIRSDPRFEEIMQRFE
jgi:hypothetical protein